MFPPDGLRLKQTVLPPRDPRLRVTAQVNRRLPRLMVRNRTAPPRRRMSFSAREGFFLNLRLRPARRRGVR